MSDRRFDFSSIDPSRDRVSWEQKISTIATRAAAAVRVPWTVSAQLAAWLRPALALAAGVAVVLWLAVPLTAPSSTSSVRARQLDPAVALERWALGEVNHSVWTQLETLGVDHEHY